MLFQFPRAFPDQPLQANLGTVTQPDTETGQGKCQQYRDPEDTDHQVTHRQVGSQCFARVNLGRQTDAQFIGP